MITSLNEMSVKSNVSEIKEDGLLTITVWEWVVKVTHQVSYLYGDYYYHPVLPFK